MTSSHQLPLFAEFPLSDFFRLREERIADLLPSRLHPDEREELVDRTFVNLEVYPIELRVERQYIEVEPSGISERTGEQVYCYTLHVPFVGDRELWLFRPEGIGACPDGEYFRLELILAANAISAEEGELLVRERLAAVEEIVRLQYEQIQAFNERLPALIWEQIDGCERKGPLMLH